MTSKTNNTTIIAEAGINHNGSSKKAINLVKAAKKCGADYIKFQIFNSQKDAEKKNLKCAIYS